MGLTRYVCVGPLVMLCVACYAVCVAYSRAVVWPALKLYGACPDAVCPAELPLSFPTQLLGRNFLPGRNLGRNFGEELGRNLNFAIILVWLFNIKYRFIDTIMAFI